MVRGRVLRSPVRSTTTSGRAGGAGRWELVAGVLLVAWTAIAAAAVARRPGADAIDRWGFSLVAPSLHSTFYARCTQLGSAAVLLGGSVLAALVVVGRDRWRAVTCLVGPAAATGLAEWVVKPLVGRRYLEVLTFPSGSVTAIAALATAWTLAVPRRLRWPMAAVGAVLVGACALGVVGLRWHLPTDALAGAVFGVGVVLLLDGTLQTVRSSI